MDNSIWRETGGGVLSRLRRDRRGNTLAMMAAFLIPVCALAGSAIDMARLYVVKVRLQQACDAGVLAGRKFMESSDAANLDDNAATQAKTFFANNFSSGWMGTPKYTSQSNPYPFTPVKTKDQQVAGTAKTTVPMTIMTMFGNKSEDITVTCEARFDVADTDIIFVLDTTGSMACPPEMSNSDCSNYAGANAAKEYTRPTSDPDAVPGYLGTKAYAVPETTAASGSRIKALRQAVKDFYATMADNIDPSTNVRYGFVTYTSTVNAGKAIYDKSPKYLMGGNAGETWNYQTRYVSDDYIKSPGTWGDVNRTKSDCDALASKPTRVPATALTYSGGEAKSTSYQWVADPGKCQSKTDTLGPRYTHTQRDWDVSGFIAGNAVSDPTKVDGSTSRWDGCIEEADTEAGKTSFTSASRDLDPDLIPSSDVTTRWKPMWADVTYGRNRSSNGNFSSTANLVTNGDSNSAPSWASDDLRKTGYVSCGKPVHPLSKMTKAEVAAYVDAPDFKPLGGTYHDTGMIWGVRMLSPNGIFASNTSAWPGRSAPKRIIIFLTDGVMSPNQGIYGMYGLEYFDRRVSGGGGSLSSLTNYHNARFLAECERARSMRIDVWTVVIGMGKTDELTKCAANSSQALATTTGAGLSDAFKQIAKQVAMLRISQ